MKVLKKDGQIMEGSFEEKEVRRPFGIPAPTCWPRR